MPGFPMDSGFISISRADSSTPCGPPFVALLALHDALEVAVDLEKIVQLEPGQP